MPAPSPTSKKSRIRAAVLDRLNEHAAAPDGLPTTIRFVFYELEQRGLAQKPQPGDSRPNRRRSLGWPPGSQDVSDSITRLREDGLIPWNWIADTERNLAVWSHAPSVREYLLDRLPEATINPWHPEPPPLVLTESNGMALVLDRVAAEYACPIAGTKGQSAGFLRTVIGPLVLGEPGHVHERDLGQHRDVLYLGDHDKSGHDIEANAERVLREMGWLGSWERIGLLPSQTTGLTPIYKTDGRDGKEHEAFEVEALGQAAVVALVRDSLDARLPAPLDRVHERENVERADEAARLVA